MDALPFRHAACVPRSSGPDRPTRLGDLDVGTWADGKVHRIGGIDYGYRAGGRLPSRAAGVDVR